MKNYKGWLLALIGTSILSFSVFAATGAPPATKLSTYTSDNVGNLTFSGYCNQFGTCGTPQIILNGSTSGAVTMQAPATGGGTITFPSGTATLAATSGSTFSGATINTSTANDLIQNGNLQSTALNTSTSSTAFSNIVGLTYTLTSGGVYNFRAHLNGTAGASGGLKLTSTGTVATSAFNATTWNYNGTTLNAVTNVTSPTSNFTAQTAAYTDALIEGSLTVTATGGGTFQLQAAQNASNGTATTVVSGSQMEIWRVQ